MKLLKAFYGYTQSAMLWYEKFKGCLEGLGFILNKYDLYIANKIIDGKQYTVGWYIGDTKISHVKANVVDWVIEQLEGKFGTTTKKRGNNTHFCWYGHRNYRGRKSKDFNERLLGRKLSSFR